MLGTAIILFCHNIKNYVETKRNKNILFNNSVGRSHRHLFSYIYINKRTSIDWTFRLSGYHQAACYDQGLVETLAQHVNDTPLFLSQAPPAATHSLKDFSQKNIANTIKHTSSQADGGEPTGTGEEPAFKLLAARLEPISSMDNLQPLKQTCNQSCTYSGNRNRYSSRETYNRNICMISGVVTLSYRGTETK